MYKQCRKVAVDWRELQQAVTDKARGGAVGPIATISDAVRSRAGIKLFLRRGTKPQLPLSKPEPGPDKHPAQVEIVEYIIVVEVPIQVPITGEFVHLPEAVTHAGERLPGRIRLAGS